MAGNFAGGLPFQGFPAPQQLPRFVPQGNQAAVQQRLPQQQVPARPIIRAQREDDPVPLSRPAQTPQRRLVISIPSPEELGVAQRRPPQNAALDWTEVHTRLDHLGASCFHLEKCSKGRSRVTCLLPTGQQGRSRRIEAEADTEAEAVRTALAKAEEFAQSR